MEKPFFVYLLRCADDTLYCGITNDRERRLAQHNKGTGAKYTKVRRPVEMVFSKEAGSKSQALRLEAHIKTLTRAQKLYLTEHPQSELSQRLLEIPQPKSKPEKKPQAF